MKHQTVLGFDFGTHCIGVAVGQTVTGTATPLPVVKAQAGEPNWHDVDDLMARWKPDALMVGMPFAKDGSEQEITRAAKKFCNQLHGRYGLKVYEIDERFTTKDARQSLFEQGGYRALDKYAVDGWSAKLIVESGLSMLGAVNNSLG
jgi:putative Holliday junction resolvase